MQKKFLSNLLLLIVLNLIIKPIAIFGIDAQVQNRVGIEEYGMYFSLLNFTYIFNILLDIGITNYNVKYVAQHPVLVKRYMGKIIPLRFFLFLVYVLFSCLLAVSLGYSSEQFWIVSLLILNQFLISIILYFRSHFAGLLLFKLEALFSILDKLLLIIICGTLLYIAPFKQHFELEWFIYAQTVSYLLVLALVVGILFRKIGIPRIKWSSAFNKVILTQSFPYALLILLMMMYTKVDAIMIERIHPEGKLQAGIYAQGFRILDAFLMFAMLFTNLLLPIFSKMIKHNEATKPLLVSAGKLIYTFSIVASIICYVYPLEILQLFYDDIPTDSVYVFKCILLSFIPNCMVLLYGTLLTANGSMRLLNIYSFIGLLLNILLNIWFIEWWGAFGAAIATLATQLMVAILQSITTYRIFQFPFVKLEAIRIVLFFTTVLFITYGINEFNFTDIFSLVSSMIGATLLAFIFKMISLKEILQLLKKEN